jgi:hypothetical protein
LDPGAVERVEAELDSFIEKRARQAKDAEKLAELWAKSERVHREKRRQANGWGWIRHYESLARTHRSLALENENKAARVRVLLGVEMLPELPPNGNHPMHSKEEEITT